MTDAITREEKLLAGIAIEPITREEMFLAKLAGQDIHTPEPITRKERLYQKIIENSGGSSGGEGESNPLDAYIEGTTTEVISNAKSVNSILFQRQADITSVNFPFAKSIGDEMFTNMNGLVTADFPMVENIGGNAFYQCINLKNINFPSAKIIGKTALTSNKITTADFPMVESIGQSSFQYCYELTTANFPSATQIGIYVFNNCRELLSANFSSAKGLPYGIFNGCTKLETVICGVDNIQSSMSSPFKNCSALVNLVLINETVATLQGVSAFEATPFASGGTGGTVYVPQALIESYKTATNWSTLYEGGTVTFLPIEGSEFE